MRRSALLLLAPLLLLSCRKAPPRPGKPASQEAVRTVVTAVPAAYEWALSLSRGCGGIEVRPLSKSMADLHSYQPSVQDMANAVNADLFVYTGGESDGWVKRMLLAAGSDAPATLCLMEALGSRTLAEETKEGMQDDGEEEEEGALDEHVWLSLRNARILCAALADLLCAMSPDDAPKVRQNQRAYDDELSALDGRIESLLSKLENRTLVFADRFPFRYFTEDYALDYYAAFPGCSAETEASFETVAFLARKADELGAEAVCTLLGSGSRLVIPMNRMLGRNLVPVELVSMEQSLSGITDTMERLESRAKELGFSMSGYDGYTAAMSVDALLVAEALGAGGTY